MRRNCVAFQALAYSGNSMHDASSILLQRYNREGSVWSFRFGHSDLHALHVSDSSIRRSDGSSVVGRCYQRLRYVSLSSAPGQERKRRHLPETESPTSHGSTCQSSFGFVEHPRVIQGQVGGFGRIRTVDKEKCLPGEILHFLLRRSMLTLSYLSGDLTEVWTGVGCSPERGLPIEIRRRIRYSGRFPERYAIAHVRSGASAGKS